MVFLIQQFRHKFRPYFEINTNGQAQTMAQTMAQTRRRLGADCTHCFAQLGPHLGVPLLSCAWETLQENCNNFVWPPGLHCVLYAKKRCF